MRGPPRRRESTDSIAEARVGGDERLGQLALELGDLVAQRPPRGALVDFDDRRARQTGRRCLDLRFEQFHPATSSRKRESTGHPPGSRHRRLRSAGRRRRCAAPPRRGSRARRRPGARTGRMRVVRLVTPWPGAGSPNSTASGPRSSATTSLPPDTGAASCARPSRSPSSATRTPSVPSTLSASSAHIGTPVSTSREHERVVEQVLGPEAPPQQALHRRRLDRRALGVRVQADVAVEHAVGPGNRVLAHRHGLGAPESVGEPAQTLAGRPAGCVPAARRRVTEISRSSGNSSRDLFGDPARDGLGAPSASEASIRAAPSR